jgi:peptidyl-dipeptidase A
MKKLFIFTILVALTISCTNISKEIAMINFIKEYEGKVQPLIKKINLASWEASVTGNREKYKEAATAEKQLASILSSKEDFEKVKNFLNGEIKDKDIKRQLKLIYNSYAMKQGDEKLLSEIINKKAEIEEKFNTFRATLDGKKVTDNQLKTILKTETKNMKKRKTAWLASKQIGNQVAEDILYLAKLRNKLAKSLGYGNYFKMSLALNEQSEKEVIGLFDLLDKMIAPEFAKVKDEIDTILAKRYKIKKSKIMPWHMEDPFFQEGITIKGIDLDKYYKDKDIIEIAKTFYSSIGLDVTDILKASSLYEQEGKMQHAFCTHIDLQGDVRILVNVKPNADWMDTVLHELGHAVYDKYTDKNLPLVFREPAHTFTTEAIAMLFGRQAKNPQFLENYCNVDKKEAEKVADSAFKSTKFQQLVFSRWCQVMTRFEKELYENPDKGVDYFNNYWWQLKEKYQLLKKPKDRNNPDWASKIHIALYPVYYHNYMLGELFASQLQAYIGKNIVKTENKKSVFLGNNKEIGKYLIDKIFNPGKKYYWNDMIQKATGEKLTPLYYKEQFISK